MFTILVNGLRKAQATAPALDCRAIGSYSFRANFKAVTYHPSSLILLALTAVLIIALLPLGLLVFFIQYMPAIATGATFETDVSWVADLGIRLAFRLDGFAGLAALSLAGLGPLFINILLALVWSALTGQFTLEGLTTGFLLGYFVLYLLRGVFGGGQYFAKGAQFARFVVFFLWELLVANIRVARDVLRPGPLRMRPRVIAVPISLRGEVPVTLLANVLSLTPGTLSLDISDDQKTLFVHAIDAPDAEQVRLEVKQGFERLVSSLLSQQEGQGKNLEETGQ